MYHFAGRFVEAGLWKEEGRRRRVEVEGGGGGGVMSKC